MEPNAIVQQELSDDIIVSGILAGEQRLFELIIRRYNQRLYRIGMSVLNDDASVEDAMQTAYIKAYEHLGQFEHRASFSTWLTRIMLNECLARKKKSAAFIDRNERELENAASMTNPSGIMMNKELAAVLEQAIARLPEKYRLVFVLREVEEMSVRETGHALGIEETNVKVRLNRAKTMLRTYLGTYMNEHIYAFHLTRCDRVVAGVMTKLGLL